MAAKTILLPLGGEVMGADTLSSVTSTNWITPIAKVQNFIPIVVSASVGGNRQLKFVKRRGFDSGLLAGTANYQFSFGIQWTGVPNLTNQYFSRGVLVYTKERSGVDLVLQKYDGAETTLGTFSTADYKCIGIQETLISGTPTLTLNVKLTSSPYGQKALYYPNGGSLTEITDADFPTTSIGNFVHLDGYAFIASTDGYIYNSDLNSVSSWTANNRIAVQMVPDSLVGLAKIRNVILALGTGSIELFDNKGLPSGSPLATSSATAVRIGVLHQRAVQEIEGGIIFVSVSPDGVGVHQWNGQGQPEKISDTIIDMNLNGYANNDVNTPIRGPLTGNISSRIFFAGTLTLFGIKIVLLYINRVCYAYAPSYKLWFLFKYADDTASPLFVNVGAFPFAIDIENTGTSGFISLAFGTTGVDRIASSTTSYSAMIVTPPLSLGSGRNKRYNKLRIIGDQIAGATCPIVVSYSDDNGQNFTTWGTIDMNVNPPVSLHRGGASRRRVWRFENTSSTGCEIDGVELTYEEMSN